ncbi:MAG: SpoIIE family protein phosphatase [Phycisphaerales bacterium]|nr:SpoIIE family protein phosphatase [Phycisphaerales bacterium]
MRLLILENQRLRKTFRADGGTISIGSDAKCHVHLPDPRLGRHQADLLLDDDGQWWIEIRDGAIPTCVNRAVQKSRTLLRHADEIEIGDYALRFFLESDKSRDELRQERLVALGKQHDDNLPLATIIRKDEPEVRVSPEVLEQTTLLLMRLAPLGTIGDTLEPILRFVLRMFDASKAWIGVRKPDSREFDWTLGLSTAGKPCVRPSYSTLLEPRCVAGAQHLCVPDVPVASVVSAMATPLPGERGNLGMLYVETDNIDMPFGEAELMAFSTIARCAAMPIDALMHKAAAHRAAAITTEKTILRATQDAVTINALPTIEGMQIAAYRRMGEETVTDYYDILTTREKKLAIVVAVIDADLLNTPRFFAELRAAFRYSALYKEAPHTFARALNWLLYNTAGHQIHMIVAHVDPANGQVDYCITGRRVHTGRITADGEGQLVRLAGHPPVGADRNPQFELNQLMLEPGQSLLICTEGAKKAVNRDGEPFGIGGVEDEVCDGLGDTPGHVLRDFAADLAEYIEGGRQPDDVSVVLLQRNDA